MESTTPINNRSKRRRPPTFGSLVPVISTRGIVTTGSSNTTTSSINVEDRDDCPMCKKFSKGPCGNIFKQWLACTDKYPGKDANGEPLHLNKCSDYAETLAECLDSNTDYYTKEDDNSNEQDTTTENDWQEFVKDMEDGIESKEYIMQPFPKQEINPLIQVSSKTGTGVCFFNSKMKGQTIIAAYVLDDDNGDVKAAGSKEDMNVQGQYMLQFKANNMKSATIRAIYDAHEDTIEIYTRTIKL